MKETVLITGGTSGFGLETAKLLQKSGYNVIIASRDPEKVKKTVLSYGFADGYCLDVTKYGDWVDIQEKIIKKHGGIDILINNAGGGINVDFLIEQTEDTINKSIAVNLMGAIYGSNVFAKDMISKKDGLIINVCSVAANHNWPKWSLYCCAKAGLQSFSETLYAELLPYGVRVIRIMPGGAITGFQKSCDINEDFEALTATDVANAILYAVSQPKEILVKEITICGTSGVE